MAYTSRARRPAASATKKAAPKKSASKKSVSKAPSRKTRAKPAAKVVTRAARPAKTVVAKAKKPARAAAKAKTQATKAKASAKPIRRSESSSGLSAVAPLSREVTQRDRAPDAVPAPPTTPAVAAPHEPVTAVGSLSIADLLERARPQVHSWSPPLEREHNRLTRRALAAHHPGFDRRRLKHQGMVAPRGEPSHRTDRKNSKTG